MVENREPENALVPVREEEEGNPLVLDTATLERRRRWGRFGKRLMMVLLRPGTFWERVKEEKISVGEMMWPHVLVMIAVRSLAGFIGNLLSDGGSLGSAAASFFSSFVSWLALVWVFAVIVGSLATTRGARVTGQAPLRFAAYGLAPLFVVGVFAAIPLPYVASIAELIAMPYTFQVMGLGVVPMLGVSQEKAPALVGLLCGLLLVLWGIMPTLVPLVVDTIAR